MPNCIIMGCPHKTGNNQKFPGIVLHSFPSSIERIKKWILQTGQVFQDPDTLANKIYEGKKTDTFRMCSAHFTKDSYIFTAQKRFLKHNALPAIFPQATEGKALIDEQKIVGKRKKKCERLEGKNVSSFICSRCLMSENIYEGKIMVDAGTQTDSDVQQTPVLPMTQAVLMLSVPFQSYCTQQITPLIKQPAHTTGSHSMVSYNSQDLLKNTDFHCPLVATSTQSFPHAVVEKGDLHISVSSHHNKDYNCIEESSPNSEVMSVQSQEDADSSTLQKMVRGRKLLVFEDCLDCLIYMVKCRGASGCTKVVKRFNKEYRGSAVIVRGQCEDGHLFKIWESQPRVRRFFAGNVLMAASMFCSGLRYQEARDFFNTLGLRHISGQKYHRLRKSSVYPAVRAAWEKEHKHVIQELLDKPISLCGDSQYGSSGPHTDHCIYMLSDSITDKIVDFEIIPSAPGQTLMDMERHGLELCMSRTIAEGLDVACFASDRYESVVEAMKENYGHVDHQFNVRRYAKRILKKLRAASRSRFCESIRPWIRTMYDHFLWSVQTSEHNADLLREKWLSVLHHIVNEHCWEQGRLYKQCEHEDLSQKTERETLWLKPGSPSFQKVQQIVSDPQLIEDLKHLTWNCHTMDHSHVLKFRTSGPHSGISDIVTRMKLAALRHNHMVGGRKAEVRAPSRTSTADDIAKGQHMTTKEENKWPPVCDPMNYDLWPLMEGVLKICEGKKTTSYISKAFSIPPSVSMTGRPNAAFAGHSSRIGFKRRKCEN